MPWKKQPKPRLKGATMQALRVSTYDDRRRQFPFEKSSKIELRYMRALRGVAREVGRIVRGFEPGVAESARQVRETLNHYAEIIRPWARETARRVAVSINHEDAKVWNVQAREMSRELKKELKSAPVGQELNRFLNENVELITSLPVEAGNRVHELTQQALVDSSRASEIKKEILRTGEVTASRAELIARTEVSRTASGLTQVRAESVGSEAYIWRTARDADVRDSHRHMEGKVVHWDNPPTLDGMVGHAGQFPNCRCYPEPIVPEEA